MALERGPFVILRPDCYNLGMYHYYVKKRLPASLWTLDTAPPFTDHTGLSALADVKSGSSAPTASVPLVAGAEQSSVFSASAVGEFECNLFRQGSEDRQFVLEAWVLPVPNTTTGPQQILSHDGYFDGLSIDGKVIKFSTEYATFGEAACEYDLIEYRAAHVVGIHSPDQNQLWINGELVASVDITEDQRGDSYISTTDFLYAGHSLSDQGIAMNGVAFYSTLPGDQIVRNFEAGRNVLSQEVVVPQFGGFAFSMAGDSGSIFIEELWSTEEDFMDGLKNNVEFSEERIVPAQDSGISLAGDWTTSVPLDSQEDTSIYGVMVQWSAKDATVDYSLDGTLWTPLTNGELVSGIPDGFDPTDTDLQIRVNFAGGVADDPAYLESLYVIGFRDAMLDNPTEKTVAVSHPAVPRGDYEPLEYRDDNGVNLSTGSVAIGNDFSDEQYGFKTAEFWIKPLANDVSFYQGQTVYRNGVPDATLPVGEWSLVHVVFGTNIDNLHPDPGFESGLNGYTTFPNGTSAVDSTFFRSGAQSLKHTNVGGGISNAHSGTLLTIPAGVKGLVTASAWFYADAGNTGVVNTRIGGSGVTSESSQAYSGNSDWQQITQAVQIDELGGTVVMYLYGSNVNGEVTWFDDLTFGLEFTISGDCIVGQISTYAEELTPEQINDIWRSYTGSKVEKFADVNTISVSEGATPASIYAHDWSIDTAG